MHWLMISNDLIYDSDDLVYDFDDLICDSNNLINCMSWLYI